LDNLKTIPYLVLLMIRRSRTGIVDFSSEEFKDEKVSYCSHCLEYGFKVPLTNRIYPDNEPAPDKDQWKMCLDCGSVFALYELERESKIQDAISTSDNPFDIGTSFLGIDSRSSKRKKRLKDRYKDLDYIKDENLKAELRKGRTLLSYIEYMPQ
jgi:hypothetical protein